MPFIFLVRYRQIWGGISWLFGLWLLCSPLFAAEIINVPDAGALMRGTQQLENFNAPMQELPERPRRELREKVGKQVFVVKNFRIIGATLVPSEDIQQTLEPWLNHEITFADLEDALQAISDLYQRYGWYARPQLPEQSIVDGVVTIRIIEGKLGAIKVDESAGADVDGERVIKTLTARQKTGDPLSFKDLERATMEILIALLVLAIRLPLIMLAVLELNLAEWATPSRLAMTAYALGLITLRFHITPSIASHIQLSNLVRLK